MEDERKSRRLKGEIVKIIGESGYGFIRDELDLERFFHANGIDDYKHKFEDLTVGMRVTFFPYRSEDGEPRAAKVRVVTRDSNVRHRRSN